MFSGAAACLVLLILGLYTGSSNSSAEFIGTGGISGAGRGRVLCMVPAVGVAGSCLLWKPWLERLRDSCRRGNVGASMDPGPRVLPRGGGSCRAVATSA